MGMDKGAVISVLSAVGGLALTSVGLWFNERRGRATLATAQTQTGWEARGVVAQETATLVQGALDMAANLRTENAQLRHALEGERHARLEAQAEAERLRAALEAATPVVEAPLPAPASASAPAATPVAERPTRPTRKPAPTVKSHGTRRPGGGKPSTKRKGARRGR